MKKQLLHVIPFLYAFSLAAMEKQITITKASTLLRTSLQGSGNNVLKKAVQSSPAWKSSAASLQIEHANGGGRKLLQMVQHRNLQQNFNDDEESKRVEEFHAVLSGEKSSDDEVVKEAANALAELKRDRRVRESIASIEELWERALFAPRGMEDPNVVKTMGNFYETAEEVHDVLSSRIVRQSKRVDVVEVLEKLKEQETTEKELLQISANGKTGRVDEIMKKTVHELVFDADGNTPFALAVKNGKLITAKKHCDAGANVNTVNKKGLSPWDYAVNGSDQNLVEFLKDQEALSGEPYRTKIFQTIQSGTIDDMKELLTFCYAEMEDEQGNSLLAVAAQYGREDMAKLLLEGYKVPIHTCNNTGLTPLDLAKTQNLKNYLMTKGALTGKQNEFKNRLFALVEKSYSQFKSLMESDEAKNLLRGDSKLLPRLINARDAQLNTLLIIAARSGALDSVKYLVEVLKAEINAFNRDGHTALHSAIISGHPVIANFLEKKGGMLYRLSSPAANEEFAVVVHVNGAEKAGCRASMQLKQHRETLNSRKEDENAFLDAARNADRDTLQRLMGKGILNTARDDKGNTALSLAVVSSAVSLKKKLEIVQYLVNSGAELNTINDEGKSILDCARHEELDIVSFLNEKGAVTSDVISERDRERAICKKCFQHAKRGDIASLKKIIEGHELSPDRVSTMRDEDDNTLLIVATIYSNYEMIKFLCQNYNVKLNIRNNVLETALTIAKEKKFDQIAKLLLSKGALTGAELRERDMLFSEAAMGKLKALQSRILWKKDYQLEPLLRFDYESQDSLLLAVFNKIDDKKDKEALSLVKYILTLYGNLSGRKDELLLAHEKALIVEYNSVADHLKNILEKEFKVENLRSNGRGSQAGEKGLLGKALTITGLKSKRNPGAVEAIPNRKMQPVLTESQQLALCIKCAEGEEKFSALVENKIDIASLTDSNGDTLLHTAVRRNNNELVGSIVKSINVNSLNDENQTALDLAKLVNNKKTIKLLEDNGALTSGELEIRSEASLCARSGNLEKLTRLIKEKNLSANLTDGRGFTLLHLAAQAGNYDVVVYLVEKCGAKLHQVTPDNQTVLHGAAQAGHYDIVVYLVEKCGAKLHQVTNDNQTVVDVAANEKIKDYLKSKGGLGCDLREKLPRLLVHAKNGELEKLENLLATLHPESPDSPAGERLEHIRDENGKTPLYVAVEQGHLPIVELLTDKEVALPNGQKHRYNVNINGEVYKCEAHGNCDFSGRCKTNDHTCLVKSMTPLDIACEKWKGQAEGEKKSAYRQIVEKLYQMQGHIVKDLDTKVTATFTRLLTDEQLELLGAIEKMHVPLVEVMIRNKNGADLSFYLNSDKTLLNFALEKWQAENDESKKALQYQIAKILYDKGAFAHEELQDTRIPWPLLTGQKKPQIQQQNMLLKGLAFNWLDQNGDFTSRDHFTDHKNPPPAPSMRFDEPPLKELEGWSVGSIQKNRSDDPLVRTLLRASKRLQEPAFDVQVAETSGHGKQRSESVVKQSMLLKECREVIVNLIVGSEDQSIKELFGYLGDEWKVHDFVAGKQTVLHMAAKNGNLAMVKDLITEKQANPCVLDSIKRTVFHATNAQCNAMLRDPEISPQEKLEQQKQYAEILMYLIDPEENWNGSKLFEILGDTFDVNELIAGTDTILHIAAKKAQLPIVKQLIEKKGANPKILNAQGKTALQVVENEHGIAAALAHSPRFTKEEQNGQQEVARKYNQIINYLKIH